MEPNMDGRDRLHITEDLASPEEDARRLAVERIWALPREQALDRLIERLGDESWRVRKAAVERLVSCQDSEAAARRLVKALADGDNPGRRNSAVEALVQCGARAVPELVEAAGSEDVDVRKFVVDALAGIGDPRAQETAVRLLRDPDPNVRAAAADALSSLGGPGICERLLEVAAEESEDQTVRFSALHSLGHLEAPVPARALRSVLGDPVLRSVGLELLGRWEGDEEAVDVLLKGLVAGSRSAREASMRGLLRVIEQEDAGAPAVVERVREAAAASPDLVDDAIGRLMDGDLASRMVIVQFLGLLELGQVAVPILFACSDEALAEIARATLVAMGESAEEALDRHWELLPEESQREACAVFARCRGPHSASRLLAILDGPEPELRVASARACAQRGIAEAAPLLIRRLEALARDEGPDAREEIAPLTSALVAAAESDQRAHGGPERIVALLSPHVPSGAEPVRLAAAKVLGHVGRESDIELVDRLLRDPSASVRRAAVETLARLAPEGSHERLRLALADESAAVRVAGAHALGSVGREPAVEDLCQLSHDEDARVRAAALRALGEHCLRGPDGPGRERALEALEGGLGGDPLVALAAIEALGALGGSEAARVRAALRHPDSDLVREAAACVGRNASMEGLEALLPLVNHDDWSVRGEAIQALAQRGVSRAVPAILRRLEVEQDSFVRDVILRALGRLDG